MILWCRNKAEHLEKRRKKILLMWKSHWEEVGGIIDKSVIFLLLLGFFIGCWSCFIFRGSGWQKQEVFVAKNKSFSRGTIKRTLVKLKSCKCTITPSSFDKVKLVIMLLITLIFITIWSLCTITFAHHVTWMLSSPQVFGLRLCLSFVQCLKGANLQKTFCVPAFC